MSHRIFEALDVSVLSAQAKWLELWRQWPTREVFAHPAYVKLFAGAVDRVVCLSCSTSTGGILFPLVVRPLAGLPWATGVEAYDATSAYGYSGPFCWNVTDEDAAAFWMSVDEWASQNRVVTTFVRCSLFEDQILLRPNSTRQSALNIVRSLNISENDLWYDYAHKVRKNVNKAVRSGLSVSMDFDGSHLDAFLEIYTSTMDRNDAGQGYYFPRSFFESIIADLSGHFVFFHTHQNERIVSTELVLVSERFMYSFLGGTLSEAFALRPNDLLKHEAILWGIRQHKEGFVLGGGYGGEDGIFHYKASFAPSGVLPFRVAWMSHDNEKVNELVARRRSWEAGRGTTWEPSSTFFPQYRG